MDATIWLANITSVLGSLIALALIANRYVIKPFKKWLELQISNVVKELQTSNGNTLGATIEKMANDIHVLQEVQSKVTKYLAID